MGNSHPASGLSQSIREQAAKLGLHQFPPQLQSIAIQQAATEAGKQARESAVSHITSAVVQKLQEHHIPVSEHIIATGVANLMEAVIPVAAEFGLAVVPAITTALSVTGIPGV